MTSRVVRIGARSSPLARAQVDLVAAALGELGVGCEFVPISTQGDVDRRELTQIGGTGVFAAAVRERLLDGSIDVAVHSAKDLPTAPVEGLEVIAYPSREDTRDVLVARDRAALELATATSGRPLLIGTGAPRRAVQLTQWAEDIGARITIEPIRGNVDTRLDQVRTGRFDATILAAAGLSRLRRFDPGREATADDPAGLTIGGLPAVLLSHDRLLPAAAQGALAVETSTALDSEIRQVLTRLDHAVTRAEVLAERRFLAVLEAGCTAPVGARAEVDRTSVDSPADQPAGQVVRGARPVRDPGADLTLVAVIGRTKGDDLAQRSAESTTGPVGAGRSEGRLIRRHRLVGVSGQGSSADPEELGGRLAELALTAVDRSEFGPA